MVTLLDPRERKVWGVLANGISLCLFGSCLLLAYVTAIKQHQSATSTTAAAATTTALPATTTSVITTTTNSPSGSSSSTSAESRQRVLIAGLALVSGALCVEVFCRVSPDLTGAFDTRNQGSTYHGVVLGIRIISVLSILGSSVVLFSNNVADKQRREAATFACVTLAGFAALALLNFDWSAPLEAFTETQEGDSHTQRGVRMGFRVLSQSTMRLLRFTGLGPPLMLTFSFAVAVIFATVFLSAGTALDPRLGLPLIFTVSMVLVTLLWMIGVIRGFKGIMRGAIFAACLTGVAGCLSTLQSSLGGSKGALVGPVVVISLLFFLAFAFLARKLHIWFTTRYRVRQRAPVF